jgi:hypothetical protein
MEHSARGENEGRSRMILTKSGSMNAQSDREHLRPLGGTCLEAGDAERYERDREASLSIPQLSRSRTSHKSRATHRRKLPFRIRPILAFDRMSL